MDKDSILEIAKNINLTSPESTTQTIDGRLFQFADEIRKATLQDLIAYAEENELESQDNDVLSFLYDQQQLRSPLLSNKAKPKS